MFARYPPGNLAWPGGIGIGRSVPKES
jgi:hypothetical protein